MLNIRKWVGVALVLGLMLSLSSSLLAKSTPQAPDFEGTQKSELDALKLPEPKNVTIAILPFWDYKSLPRHVEDTMNLCRALLERHGFVLISQDAVNKAIKEDKELEAGVPMRRVDAVRLGSALGAQWVVYGDIYELETYTKVTFFNSQKKGKISLKISVVDVAAGNVMYWHKRSDTISGGIGVFVKDGASVEKDVCERCMGRAFDMLLTALPKHEIKPVTDTSKSSGSDKAGTAK